MIIVVLGFSVCLCGVRKFGNCYCGFSVLLGLCVVCVLMVG